METSNESNNPFKINDNHLVPCIILSGLIIYDHVKSLLKSLGNGPDALKTVLHFNQSHHADYNTDVDHQQHDLQSLSSSYLRNYYPGHSILAESENRWSYTHSFKSIELNPGIWHWWQKIWWACFPCCMPGGCYDRICVKLKGHVPKSNSRAISRKGWQQYY